MTDNNPFESRMRATLDRASAQPAERPAPMPVLAAVHQLRSMC
jgi:hypothetical protein